MGFLPEILRGLCLLTSSSLLVVVSCAVVHRCSTTSLLPSPPGPLPCVSVSLLLGTPVVLNQSPPCQVWPRILNLMYWRDLVYNEVKFTGHRDCCLVAQSCPTLCDPVDCSPTRLLCPWDFPGKNTGVDCHFLLLRIVHLPDPGLKPESPARLFTTEPPGKP